jgi:hypothetical protein
MVEESLGTKALRLQNEKKNQELRQKRENDDRRRVEGHEYLGAKLKDAQSYIETAILADNVTSEGIEVPDFIDGNIQMLGRFSTQSNDYYGSWLAFKSWLGQNNLDVNIKYDPDGTPRKMVAFGVR